MKRLSLMSVAAVCALATPAGAAEWFEGIWAQSRADCLDREGANSRTYISLSEKMGKVHERIFDQYEHHCRIDGLGDGQRSIRIEMTCYEFWEYFEKRNEGKQDAATLSRGPTGQSIRINGKSYRRCTR